MFGLETVKLTEASLPMNTSHDALRGHVRTALKAAHGIKPGDYSEKGPWVSSLFPSHAVYQWDEQLYRRPYTVEYGAAGADPTVKLGAAKPCHAAYMDSKFDEAAAVMLEPGEAKAKESDETFKVSEGIQLVGEISIKESGVAKIPVKIISAGWGSMAYYPKEVLKRDGPTVFPAGTHMMWNHASESEELDRPEGDLGNLAAVLTKAAEWKDDGPNGPGLYSEAKVFSDYATQVTEKGPYIGVSINAAIRATEGTREGRTGRIAEQFVRAYSADFVTKAGAGGAPIVPVVESDRGRQESTTMTADEQKAFDDLKKANESLTKTNGDLTGRLAVVEKSQDRVLALATVAAVLREAGISYRQPLLERACENPVMKEGKLDPEWVKAVAADFSEGAEIRGFGESQTRESTGDDQKALDVANKRLKESLVELGIPATGLDYAIAGRA